MPDELKKILTHTEAGAIELRLLGDGNGDAGRPQDLKQDMAGRGRGGGGVGG